MYEGVLKLISEVLNVSNGTEQWCPVKGGGCSLVSFSGGFTVKE